MITGIHHISMKCGTPEALAAVKDFYCGLLGLAVVREWPEGIMIAAGAGLIEVFSNGEGIREKGAVRHAAFSVDDVDALAERIGAAGYEVFLGPKDIVIPSDPPLHARMAFCRGPLGEEIELFHEKPAPEEAETICGAYLCRRLRAEDLEAFIAVRLRQLREEGAKEDTDLVPALRDYYARHMADGIFTAYLALDGDRIVGTGAMSFVEKPPYYGCPNGRIGLLSGMYTDPGYRRRGIGRALLNKVLEAARAHGCGVVQITASDMGVKLYTACGFVKNGNFMQYRLN